MWNVGLCRNSTNYCSPDYDIRWIKEEIGEKLNNALNTLKDKLDKKTVRVVLRGKMGS